MVLVEAAVAQTAQRVVYDGSYRRIPYPGRRRSREHLVHNIGRGPEVEDMLLRFPTTGHYRYRGQ